MFGTASESQENLICSLYPELRAMAGRFLRKERDAHTLQRTALVHETLLRLFKDRENVSTSAEGFMAQAAHQMRLLLIDYGRNYRAQRRSGNLTRVPLFEADSNAASQDDQWSALNEALEQLGQLDARLLAVVELKSFSGCTTDEAAAVLNVSDGTVEADWKFARSWLYERLTRRARPRA